MGRQHNKFGGLVKSSSASVSKDDTNFQLQLHEFPHDTDSTSLVRERARGSKLEPVYPRQQGQILAEPTHTLSLLPAIEATSRLSSKRDVAHAHHQTDEQTPPREQNTRREVTNQSEATVINAQTIIVPEQIAAPQLVGPNDKACKQPEKRFLHAEVPVCQT